MKIITDSSLRRIELLIRKARQNVFNEVTGDYWSAVLKRCKELAMPTWDHKAWLRQRESSYARVMWM
jgi:hypothetical protein